MALSREEVLAIMSLPKSVNLAVKYKKIYRQATGKEYKNCCGTAITDLYKLCLDYSRNEKKMSKI